MQIKRTLTADRSGTSCRAARRGAVLLEVVLALALFVAAAAIVGASINSSLNALERTKLQTHAVNLAVSIFSEIQMGLRPALASPPEAFPAPFEDWIWQLEPVSATESFFEMTEPSPTTTLQVIVHHTEFDTVHRLTQIVPVTAASSTDTNAPAKDNFESLLPE